MTRISKSFSRPIQSYESAFLCMLDSYVICVSALHLEIVFSHKIVGVAAFLFRFAAIYIILPRGCQSAAFRRFIVRMFERGYTAGRT